MKFAARQYQPPPGHNHGQIGAFSRTGFEVEEGCDEISRSRVCPIVVKGSRVSHREKPQDRQPRKLPRSMLSLCFHAQRYRREWRAAMGFSCAFLAIRAWYHAGRFTRQQRQQHHTCCFCRQQIDASLGGDLSPSQRSGVYVEPWQRCTECRSVLDVHNANV